MPARPLSPAALTAALVAALSAGCGYGLAGRRNPLPPNVRVIAVPGLVNRTRAPRVAQMLTRALARELIRRSRYRVQPQVAGSDAVLRGAVLAVAATPVTFDPNNGHATTVEVDLRLRVSLTDRLTGRTLYQNNDLVFHDQYQISTQAGDLFEEDSLALRRISQAAAQTIVSAILEGF